MRLAILTFIAITLSACAKSNNIDASASAIPQSTGQKVTVRNVWYPEHDPAWTIDFTNADLSGSGAVMTWKYSTGGACQSVVIFTSASDQTMVSGGVTSVTGQTGSFIVSGSTATASVAGMPTCSQFDGSYTFTVSNGVLSLPLPTGETAYFN